jgi:hypothetical protein
MKIDEKFTKNRLIDLFFEKKFFKAFQKGKTIQNRLKNKDFSLSSSLKSHKKWRG